jgi:hypothetical protein
MTESIAGKPERRPFSVSHGEYFEDQGGKLRDCYPIAIRGSRAAVVADLRRDHGFSVVLAHNSDFALDYLVAGNPDRRFTEAQVIKIGLVYGQMIRMAQKGEEA